MNEFRRDKMMALDALDGIVIISNAKVLPAWQKANVEIPAGDYYDDLCLEVAKQYGSGIARLTRAKIIYDEARYLLGKMQASKVANDETWQ